MAKVDKAIPEEIPIEEAPAVIQEAAAALNSAAPLVVPIPKTEAEREALESELVNYSRKTIANMAPEDAAKFHIRRYHVCLALRGMAYDRATVPIPERDAERAALEHELENSTYYGLKKPVEAMTPAEANAYYIRRRQIMFALAGQPDDTTQAARDHIRRCCV